MQFHQTKNSTVIHCKETCVSIKENHVSIHEGNYLNKRFFYKQHFYKQRQAEIGKKKQANAEQQLRLNFCYLKIICILHPHYHPKIIGYILKK